MQSSFASEAKDLRIDHYKDFYGHTLHSTIEGGVTYRGQRCARLQPLVKDFGSSKVVRAPARANIFIY